MKINLILSNLKSLGIKRVALYIGLIFLLFGCAAKEDKDCLQLLDERDFSSVANDSACSTYERASAEMGLAGFLFSNFLKDNASDNFRQSIGIPDNLSNWNTSNEKTHYDNAKKLSGDSSGDHYEKHNRATEDIEIHYFATLVSLIGEAYVGLDSNADGKITESEVQNFTNIRDKSDPNFGSNNITPASWVQFVDTSGNAFLIDLDKTSGQCQKDSNKDGIWDDSIGYDLTDSTNCGIVNITSAETAQWITDGSGSKNVSGQCLIVAKVNNIQNLFQENAELSSSNVTTLSNNFVSSIKLIDRDMASLGIAKDSDLRKSLNAFSEELDNGATCTNSSKTEIDQVYGIIEVSAAENQNSYQDWNTLKISKVKSSSDSAFSTPSTRTTFSTGGVTVTLNIKCSNSADLDTRLIFKKADGAYTASYSSALDAINNTFSNLKKLNQDESGDVKPQIKGDNIVAFQELFCAIK